MKITLKKRGFLCQKNAIWRTPMQKESRNAPMNEKIGFLTRLKYVFIALLLFLLGFVLMLQFFLIITIPFALAVWAWAGIFVYLAATGTSYGDFSETLPQWHRRR
jgi:hypothetical protein